MRHSGLRPDRGHPREELGIFRREMGMVLGDETQVLENVAFGSLRGVVAEHARNEGNPPAMMIELAVFAPGKLLSAPIANVADQGRRGGGGGGLFGSNGSTFGTVDVPPLLAPPFFVP